MPPSARQIKDLRNVPERFKSGKLSLATGGGRGADRLKIYLFNFGIWGPFSAGILAKGVAHTWWSYLKVSEDSYCTGFVSWYADHFWHERTALQSVAVRRSTGNDVSGLLFSP